MYQRRGGARGWDTVPSFFFATFFKINMFLIRLGLVVNARGHDTQGILYFVPWFCLS